MDLHDSAWPILISTSSTHTLFPSSSHSQLLSHSSTTTTANDCPASTHHVNPAAVLIRKPLTEWQAHGVYTLQHPHSLTLHVLLYTILLQPIFNSTHPTDAITKVLLHCLQQCSLLAATRLTAFSCE
ncbi:predicted protein [Lichtheimia corymbifera JMRC:FSU:9682]|uniref:Uncharacterized protein n=1 Tax=Lichtheimia corymbifera JMRC:FSU:9682 TaxID=1263082 RepID=A0A068S8Q0_9FUNG|nr:predicted protein [Lichtheimia corymbifera JMRC:FSU:9682]